MKMLQIISESDNLYRYSLESVSWYSIVAGGGPDYPDKDDISIVEVFLKGMEPGDEHEFYFTSRDLADAAISIIDV